MDGARARGRLMAVLGPTNTGKTHFAIERMLGHRSGTIGFPLRLLARENYDKVVRLKGRAQVALVTGEEKILPPGARYFVCTVESMPLDRAVDFLAVDEIQLCADAERGHIFTHRLLHARGSEETLLLGAETMRPLIRQLLPDAEFLSRPRFSTLAYTGARKLTRLPPKSAVIAFSATEVYHLAELLRRQRGGTAVVLGALSPRTRNAQVGMYQAGEVDYLVATDAIGMGLNMDIDHVAFARLVKFDGEAPRRLRAQEIAQIAGRAGRHMTDGTFGVTDDAPEIDEETVAAVEEHRFEPLRALLWRNSDLDFAGPLQLLRSLEARPTIPQLRRAHEADDQLALAALTRDAEIAALARGQAATRLLWEVCQVPDFRKVLSDAHTRLLGRLYRQLAGPDGRLDTAWVAAQLSRLDRVEGDIDALVTRIAHVRTWTYIAYRADWLADPVHWQGQARAIEDRLSDALHERLTQRFVDRRSTLLARRIGSGDALLAAVTRAGEVLVEGEHVGRLDGFRFQPDAALHSEEARALVGVARRALRHEIAGRVRRLEDDGDDQFSATPSGRILWRGAEVAQLAAGATALAPGVRVLSSDLLEPAGRDRVGARLQGWAAAWIRSGLKPLTRLLEAPLSGPARGIAFQLAEGLGMVARSELAGLVGELTRADRQALAALGLQFGRLHLFLPKLLKPAALALRGLLWAIAAGHPLPVAAPAAAAPSVPGADAQPDGLWAALGYVPIAGRAYRVDRLAALDRQLLGLLNQAVDFAPLPAMAQALGCARADLPAVLAALGYRPADVGAEPRYTRDKRGTRRRRRGAAAADPSPFAVLTRIGRKP